MYEEFPEKPCRCQVALGIGSEIKITITISTALVGSLFSLLVIML